MGEATKTAVLKVEKFFQEAEKEIRKIYRSDDPEHYLNFLKYYTDHFPTPAEFIYKDLFDKDPELSGRYQNYTLTELKPGAEVSASVEKCREKHTKRVADYYAQKEAYDRDPQNTQRPNKPDINFTSYFYNGIIKKTLSEEGIVLPYWREKIAKQGYLLQLDSEEADTVRKILFHLAFALKWDVETLERAIKKVLLQPEFNPKDTEEVIFWYCLKHKISYADMCIRYLHYSDTPEFYERYCQDVDVAPDESENTLYMKDALQEIEKHEQENGRDKEMFFRHLWFLKHRNLDSARKTPGKVYWDRFYLFPQAVWMGTGDHEKVSVTAEDLRRIELIRKEHILPEGICLNTMDEILCAAVDAKKKKNIEKSYASAGTEVREGIAAFLGCEADEVPEKLQFLEVKAPYFYKWIKEKLITDIMNGANLIGGHGEASLMELKERMTEDPLEDEQDLSDRKKKRDLSNSVYMKILPLILEKSRKNAYAACTQDLLPKEILVKLFGKLEFTKDMVDKRKRGNVPLTRTEVIATGFISFAYNVFAVNPDIKIPAEVLRRTYISHMKPILTECGFRDIYLLSPFDLFTLMCLMHEDPLAYFLASWEAAGNA